MAGAAGRKLGGAIDPERSRDVLGQPHTFRIVDPRAFVFNAWFNRHSGMAQKSEEPELTRQPSENLWCTPRGQVSELKPMTEFSYGSEVSRRLRATRPQLSGEALRKRITAVLKLPAREGICDYRIMRQPRPRGYPKRSQGEYLLETEGDIHTFVYLLNDSPIVSRPPRGPKRAVLYVSHQSADRQRTLDLLRVLDWIASYGHEEVHLVARGWGAIPGTLAAVLHDCVTEVT